MARRIVALSWVLLFSLYYPSAIMSAPDPSEVEKLKAAAPLQIIATVKSDVFHKDLTVDDFNQQIRKMELKIEKVIKAPETLGEIIEVFYIYIPSWQEGFAGGKRMDISINDEIEIWLEEGEFGWEPVLGGNTVTHLYYSDQRSEPIQEPFMHKINRLMNVAIKTHMDLIVFISLLVLLTLILITISKKHFVGGK